MQSKKNMTTVKDGGFLSWTKDYNIPLNLSTARIISLKIIDLLLGIKYDAFREAALGKAIKSKNEDGKNDKG